MGFLAERTIKNLKFLVFSGSLYYLFINKIMSISPAQGPSMLPTIAVTGDFLLYDLFYWKFKELERFSMFVFESPEAPDRMVVKRILGLEGDEIFVDPTVSNDKIIVPKGHVWMQGDNYLISNDSRFYGAGKTRFWLILVPIGLLRGKVIKKFRPFWNGEQQASFEIKSTKLK